MANVKDDAAVSSGKGQPLASFELLVPARIHKLSDTLEDVARLMLGEAYGLGFTETRILAYLRENSSASVIDISRDLQVDKAWISRRLQSLAVKNLIAKKPDISDSRAILVSLTGKGKLAAERAMSVVRQTYSTIMNGVDVRIANELITTLESNLRSILSQLRAGQEPGADRDTPV